MGATQIGPANAISGDASADPQGIEANCAGGRDAASPQPPSTAETEGAGEGQTCPTPGGGAIEESLPKDAMPSESEILARLVANLGQCPGGSMALADIRERLPPALRRMAEDTESICKWLRGFQGLFQVSGPPGGEQITLTVGKLPRPAENADHASTAGAALGSAASGTEAASTAPREANVAARRLGSANEGCLPSLDGGTGLADEDGLNPSTVQLRGLPFRSTIADIKVFLGEYTHHLVVQEPPIRLLLNRDGRPSGFARVQFTTPQAAQACREALHRQLMGDRYIEVLACSERAGKARHRRAPEEGAADAGAPVPGDDGTAEYAERDRVLQECQDHMRLPGRNQLLLSMLGIALSQSARAYLRRANLGLKHFLTRFPNEFRVEGPKGSERVILCGPGTAAMLPKPEGGCTTVALEDAVCSAWPAAPAVREPLTPRPATSTNKAGLLQSSQCVRTPSDWGTPGPLPHHQGTMPDSNAALGMEFGTFPADGTWAPYAWPPWPGQAWMPWQANATGVADTSAHQAARGDQPQAASSSGKRSKSGDVLATRSHAHLHPQSHPFANRNAGNSSGAGTAGTLPSATAADSQGKGPAIPALRLRGLPFNVTVQDVLAFFAQHEVADRIADGPQAAQLLTKANGRPSGQAVVQMRSRYDAEVAQSALCNQFIGSRYIEVFVYGDETDLQNQDVGLQMVSHAGDRLHDQSQWPLPPWAGVVPPPLPGAAANGEACGGEGWAQVFDWLWHGHEQMPDRSAAAAAGGTSGSGASATSASAMGLPVASMDAPARTTLQV